jgi:hypothetical protein
VPVCVVHVLASGAGATPRRISRQLRGNISPTPVTFFTHTAEADSIAL